MSAPNFFNNEPDFKPLSTRAHDFTHSAEFDITAMIDLVFMMNIFFMVTSITSSMADIDLPTARNVVAADRETAYVISVVADPDSRDAMVYPGGDDSEEPITDPKNHQKEIREAVATGINSADPTVIIRAERQVRLREVMMVAKAARSVEGVTIKFAVTEIE